MSTVLAMSLGWAALWGVGVFAMVEAASLRYACMCRAVFVPPLPSREPLMVAGLLGPCVRAGGYTDTAHMSGAIAPS